MSRQQQPSNNKERSTMPFADSDGVRIHWQERGSGTPILLIMGATYSSRLWYPVLDALAERHRVISFDNRGAGESESTAVASISDMAADARAVLDAAGAEAAHVFGVSLGGVVTLQLALESPERIRSLVLGCTGILSKDKPRAPKVLNWIPRTLLRRLTSTAGYGPAADPESIRRDLEVLATDRIVRRSVIAQQNALRAYSVSPEEVARLQMPALVLHGTADKVVRPDWGAELAHVLPNSRYITYPGAGHNFFVAARDEANADTLAFLAEVDAASSRPDSAGSPSPAAGR
jgi:3-oxoadipate enol-lactonase